MTPTRIFAALSGAPVHDVPERESRNGLIHIATLTMSKTADSFLDPKLVLSWLLSALGAPAVMVGLLVPVREAGALLPQLALARVVETARRRKWIWASGAAGQGMAALGIAAAALLLEGPVAGAAILGLLGLLSVSRAAASVSQKDALARTVEKGRRGAITGLAGSVAAILGFSFGLLMAFGVFPLAVPTLASAIALAGGLLLLAGTLFTRLDEPASETQPDAKPGFDHLVEPLLSDPQLRVFVTARAALTVTALAPPFIVLLSSVDARQSLDQLGPLVMAATAGSVLASYVWGRISDRSSRKTLMAAGGMAAICYAAIGLSGLLTGALGSAAAAAAVFITQIAYEGVRAGRKLHLTDMTGDAFRARYTALSNTLIGVVLVFGGASGLAADAFGAGPVLIVFACLAALGAAIASRLEEVQAED